MEQIAREHAADAPPRTLRSAGVAALCVAAVFTLFAPAARAASNTVPCEGRAVSQVFAPWGDSADYFLLENGGFEAGASSWALAGGAAVVPGNESYYVHGGSDSLSLSLPGGGSATSRQHCVTAADQNLRFFVRSTGPAWSYLRIDATFRSETRTTRFTNLVFATGSAWTPTRVLTFGLTPEQLLGQDVSVQFTFTAVNGSWQVDDLYVDPIKGR